MPPFVWIVEMALNAATEPYMRSAEMSKSPNRRIVVTRVVLICTSRVGHRV